MTELAEKEVLININQLEDEIRVASMVAREIKEKEILERWMSLFTTEYIRETIQTAINKKYHPDIRKITLWTEVYNPCFGATDNTLSECLQNVGSSQLTALFEEVIPPYATSVKEIIESRVDMTNGALYLAANGVRYSIILDYRPSFWRAIDLSPVSGDGPAENLCRIGIQIGICCFCLCLCCK